MNTAQLLTLHDQQQRIAVEYHNMRREAAPEVVRHVALDQSEGFVMYSHLNVENADRVIDEQIAYFESLGQSFEWKTYDHDAPIDLKDRLIAHGFEAEEPEALLVLDIDTPPSILLQPVAHDVRRVTEPERVAEVRAVLESVWQSPQDWLIPTLRDDLENDPDHLSVYIGYADDRPVSAAWITFHERSQFAGLWGGSTLEEYRQRGFYTALLAVRLQEARRRGVRFLTIDASPMSRPIVEKHGFQFLTMTQPMKWRIK